MDENVGEYTHLARDNVAGHDVTEDVFLHGHVEGLRGFQ